MKKQKKIIDLCYNENIIGVDADMKGKYSVKKYNKDFHFLNYPHNTKGSRLKRLTIDKDKNKAWFKY